jgi:hypothetical protein
MALSYELRERYDAEKCHVENATKQSYPCTAKKHKHKCGIIEGQRHVTLPEREREHTMTTAYKPGQKIRNHKVCDPFAGTL